MKICLIFGLMLLALLAVSGCSGGEKLSCPPICDDFDPCTADSCSEATGFQCRHTPIPGCTNECGVPCSGAAGMYMEMKCDPATKQCASDVKQGLKISTSSLTNEMLSMGTNFRAITTYSQPFNMKKDYFNVRISATQIGPGISDINIKKIEISGTDANRQTVTLGEKSMNRHIWGLESVIEEDIKVDFATSENDGQFSNFKMRVIYEYTQVYSGQLQVKSANFEIQLRGVTFSWLNPGMTQSCPAVCDDSNEGTADICNAQTGFFCVHQPIPGKCGNYICDATENKCTCEEDCGPCSGDAGQYLYYACQNNECVTGLKPGILQQPKSVTDEKNRNFYYLQNLYTFNDPFNVKADSIDVQFKLYSKQSSVGQIKLVEAKVLDRTTQLASAPISAALNSVGDTASIKIPLSSFVGLEDSKSLSLRVDMEYEYITLTATEQRKDSFIATLGTITLINPTMR